MLIYKISSQRTCDAILISKKIKNKTKKIKLTRIK